MSLSYMIVLLLGLALSFASTYAKPSETNDLEGRTLDKIGGGDLIKAQTLDRLGGGEYIRGLDRPGSYAQNQALRGAYVRALLDRDGTLDKIGGGEFIRNLPSYHEGRALDKISGGEFIRALDKIGGGEYIRNVKRGLDSLSGMAFGGSKRFDTLSGLSFGAPNKKWYGNGEFDEIDNVGWPGFHKRNFDEIDRSGFGGFFKRDTSKAKA